MELNRRQWRALEAICDTFAPGADGTPGATAMGVPAVVWEAVTMNPREAERKQVAQLLSLWDTHLLTALGGGGLSRFSELSPERRERVLLSWCDSRVSQRRSAFQALRKAALLFYYMVPGPSGDRSPVWDAIGYAGPLGKNPDAPPKALRPLDVDGDSTIDCDVCVVGSGAGGGTAAGVLAAAGLDVVVLESGGYYDDEDFDGGELEGYGRMYMYGGGAATHDQSVGLLAGSCLGGGTTVNYTTSFRTPDDVREEWASHGVPAFASEEYGASLDAVCDRLGVNQEHNAPSAREQVLQRGLTELGWHADFMPRNVRGCEQGEKCGYCNYGCRFGAKQSTVKTWLADAHTAGARILVNTRAEKVVVEGGGARGVEARTTDGHRVTVRARAVVAACGAIHTPAFLRRSGLENQNIGKHLRLHPATVIWGVFDEEVRPWEGTMQAIYSDQDRYMDGGYGVKYETAAIHPSLLVVFSPWRGSREHSRIMEALPNSVPIGVLLRDRDAGEVRVDRAGHPIVRYKLSGYDTGHVRRGVEGAAQIHEAAGAQHIFSSHSRDVSYRPGNGRREQFIRDADGCGWDAGHCTYGSFHIMGSARMGGSPETSACNPRGETWEVRDLYVCDASAFPTASGVNPMISIESIAHMNAIGIADTLR
jgi:long-chain-alcohol oxidase